MIKRAQWMALLLALGVAATGAWSCKPKTELSEEDQQARIDDEGEDREEPADDVELFPDTVVGKALDEHLLVLALPAEDPQEADRRAAESLDGLREQPGEAVELLIAAYRDIAEDRYYDRWALVKTLADLEAKEAYETLSSIARSPLPAERHEDTHHFSTQEDEIMIRLRAVEGLAALAGQGHEAAEKDLFALATGEPYASSGVRVRAIKAFIRSGSDREARVKQLVGRLPEELHAVATLEVTPQQEFEARVTELATIAEETTNVDGAEERLPEEEGPTAGAVEGGYSDDTGE